MTISSALSSPVGSPQVAVPVRAPVVDEAQAQTQSALIQLLKGSVLSSLSSQSLNVSRLSSAATSIITNAVNYQGNVALSVSGLPFGVNYTLTPATIPGTGSSNLVISAASTAKPGTYTVIVRTAAGGGVGLSALTLTIS